MSMLRRALLSTVLSALLLSSLAAQVDVTTLGPQVGATIPEFRGVDQNGREQTLETIVGPKGAMVVFFRSADW